MEDFRGNEVKIGDKVVVARKEGHSVMLTEGTVVNFTKSGKITIEYYCGWKAKGHYNSWNVCKIPE